MIYGFRHERDAHPIKIITRECEHLARDVISSFSNARKTKVYALAKYKCLKHAGTTIMQLKHMGLTNPTDQRMTGTKRSVLSDGKGVPIAAVIEEPNRYDMETTETTLEAQCIVPLSDSYFDESNQR